MFELLRYLSESEKARMQLQTELSMELDDIDIQDALQDTLQLDCPEKLLDHDLDAQTIVKKLKDYPFSKNKPHVVEIVTLNHPVIPAGFGRHLREETVKAAGEVWRIHKNDLDPFPSNPHAHNMETGCSLDLGNGKLYKKRVEKGSIRKKQLLVIRGRVQKIELPPLRI